MNNWIIGIDEAGWGSFAGPLVVAACLRRADMPIDDVIKDSKKLSKEKLKDSALSVLHTGDYSYAMAFPHNVKGAVTRYRHEPAFSSWGNALTRLVREVVDNVIAEIREGNTIAPIDAEPKIIIDGEADHGITSLCAIPKADATIAAVASASILAKHFQIQEFDSTRFGNSTVPARFGFTSNHGYGTPAHIKALNEYGPIEGLHRMNIGKVRDAYDKRGYYTWQKKP